MNENRNGWMLSGLLAVLIVCVACNHDQRSDSDIADCIRASLSDSGFHAKSEIFVRLDNANQTEQISDLQITTLGRLVIVIEDEDRHLPFNALSVRASVFCRDGKCLSPIANSLDRPPQSCGEDCLWWRGVKYDKIGRSRTELSITHQHFEVLAKSMSSKVLDKASLDGLWLLSPNGCVFDGHSFRRCDKTLRIIDFGGFAIGVTRNSGHWEDWLVLFFVVKPYGLLQLPVYKVHSGWEEEASCLLACGNECLARVIYSKEIEDRVLLTCAGFCGDPDSSMARVDTLWDDRECEVGELPDLLTTLLLSQ